NTRARDAHSDVCRSPFALARVRASGGVGWIVSGRGNTEDANKAHLRGRLAATLFEVYSEVWVREPLRGMTARMDFALVARDELLDDGFPFDVVGVEVKRSPLQGSDRRHALGQCLAYRQCVLVDKRLPAARGLAIPAVALYAAGESLRGVWPLE